MRLLFAAFLVCVGLPLQALAVDRVTYQASDRTCDGWPRAPIGMAPGFCAGIVVAPPADFGARVLVFPRLLLALPGGTDWLVTDLGHWGSHDGKLVKLTAVRGQPVRMVQLLTGLYMPHGLARGPDGKIYVGETGRIFRFDPDATDPQASIEPVVKGLPDEHPPSLHPLVSFLFDSNGDLLVGVGAPSDQCATANQPNGTGFCIESEGEQKTAMVRRYDYLGDGKWSEDFAILARGLRNSMALIRHSSGTLLQAENGMDFPTDDSPFEELNILHDGAHYGWPYCYEMDQSAPAWAATGAMDCAGMSHEKPAILLPPHAAPLSMTYYDGTMFPMLRGQLLMTWHGYRPAGARIAAFKVDLHGVPLPARHPQYAAYAGSGSGEVVAKSYLGPGADVFILTPGWNEVGGKHPRGAPVGLAVAEDGAIWVSEDRNATILRIARDRP
jgi:glucose/arabinose dehydrogenase